MIIQIEQLTDTLEETKNQNKIVVFNDDVNTFDHVIDCLVIHCQHEHIQAEQCALIIHNNGKCEVKTGDYDDLKPICSFLLEEGLTAEIQ
jgi:ATP-dependent Clp protease adaptor protein ClpS